LQPAVAEEEPEPVSASLKEDRAKPVIGSMWLKNHELSAVSNSTIALMEVAETEEEPANKATRPEDSRISRVHPLLRQRWVRRLLRFLGIRPPARPTPTCHGVTRLGKSCRGPAMANGFCRQHGGSRRSLVFRMNQLNKA
jgi:hypothetical protein